MFELISDHVIHTFGNVVIDEQMIGQETLVLHQQTAQLTLPGLVTMRGLVQLPLLIVEEGLVAEVAGVAVPGLLAIR